MTNGGPKSQTAQSVWILHINRLILIICVSCSVSGSTQCQQPFITDDAEVVQRRKFHLQIGNEFDILQRSKYPVLRQNFSAFELDYGLFNGVEVGVSVPLLAISHSHIREPKTIFGFSDSTVHLKYNFYKERAKSRLPAMTLSAVVQFPTGDAKTELGSGLTDYYVNGILQKSFRSRTILRVNGGILFSGNEQTGVLGIRTKGRVFTGGASLVRQFTNRLDLGALRVDRKVDLRLRSRWRTLCSQPARRSFFGNFPRFLSIALSPAALQQSRLRMGTRRPPSVL